MPTTAVVAVALIAAALGAATALAATPRRASECTGQPTVKIEPRVVGMPGPHGRFYRVSYGGSWQTPADSTQLATADFTVKDETGKVWQTYSGQLGTDTPASRIGHNYFEMSAGQHTLTITLTTPCGSASDSASFVVPVSAPLTTASAKGGYPWASAPCEFGDAGGAKCANPKRPRTDLYDWYLDENKNGRLDGANEAKGVTCGTNFSLGECFDQWGYEYRNCTSYVAWRLSASHTAFSQLGDASSWIANAKTRKSQGVAVDDAKHPTKGAVAVWTGTNHVAYVDDINNGVVYVSDYNGGSRYGAYGAPHALPSQPSGYIRFPAKG